MDDLIFQSSKRPIRRSIINNYLLLVGACVLLLLSTFAMGKLILLSCLLSGFTLFALAIVITIRYKYLFDVSIVRPDNMQFSFLNFLFQERRFALHPMRMTLLKISSPWFLNHAVILTVKLDNGITNRFIISKKSTDLTQLTDFIDKVNQNKIMLIGRHPTELD